MQTLRPETIEIVRGTIVRMIDKNCQIGDFDQSNVRSCSYKLYIDLRQK